MKGEMRTMLNGIHLTERENVEALYEDVRDAKNIGAVDEEVEKSTSYKKC